MSSYRSTTRGHWDRVSEVFCRRTGHHGADRGTRPRHRTRGRVGVGSERRGRSEVTWVTGFPFVTVCCRTDRSGVLGPTHRVGVLVYVYDERQLRVETGQTVPSQTERRWAAPPSSYPTPRCASPETTVRGRRSYVFVSLESPPTSNVFHPLSPDLGSVPTQRLKCHP